MTFKTFFLISFGSFVIGEVSYWFRKNTIGNAFLVLGVIVTSGALIMRGFSGTTWHAFPAVDELYLTPVVIALIALFLPFKEADRSILVIGTSLIIFSLFAVIIPYSPFIPTLKIETISASAFFMTEAISAGLFIAAGSIAVSSLVSGNGRETIFNCLISWGFVSFTICQVMGAVWAYLGWSYPFSWSTRHLLSASLWCIYAALIHSHLVKIRPKTKYILAIIAFLPLIYMLYHHQVVSWVTTMWEKLS